MEQKKYTSLSYEDSYNNKYHDVNWKVGYNISKYVHKV